MAGKKLSELMRVIDAKTISPDDTVYGVIGAASRAVPFQALSSYLGNRSGFYGVRDFGAAGDGGTDDLAAIQSAIDAAAANGGGVILLPAGVYALSAPLTLKSGVSLQGTRPAPAFTQSCPDLGIILGTGTWLRPVDLGTTNGIEFNTDANPLDDKPVSNVEIAGIGFYGFSTAIKAGALNHLSFGLGRLQDLVFLGGDANTLYTTHALDLENFQHLQFNHVKAFHCHEPFSFKANHQICSPGNSVIVDLYAYMGAYSSGNYGLRLQATDGSRQLNALTVIRPQINWFNGGTAGKSNILLEGVGSGQVVQCHLTDTDTEGANGAHIRLINAYNCSVTIAVAAVDALESHLILSESSCVIYSHAPQTTIQCDDVSSSHSQIFGIIHSVTGAGIPWGTRIENGYVPRQFVTALSRDALALRNTEASAAVRQTNGQIVQQITNVSGTGYLGNLSAHQAGTVYVTLTAAANGTIYLPTNSTSNIGLTYTLVKKDSFNTSVIVRTQPGQTINGYTLVELKNRWDYAILQAVDDAATWLVLGTNGVLQ